MQIKTTYKGITEQGIKGIFNETECTVLIYILL